MTVQKLVFYLF